MNYYGIITPDNIDWIGWIGSDEHRVWSNFFNDNPHKLPLAEAIKAYKSIGYKFVELEIKIK